MTSIHIRPGDKLRCCYPGFGNILVVREVVDGKVYTEGQFGSYIGELRIHTDPDRKAGWYLMPREEGAR